MDRLFKDLSALHRAVVDDALKLKKLKEYNRRVNLEAELRLSSSAALSCSCRRAP